MVAKYVTRARVKKYKDILKEQNSTTQQKAFDPQKWPLLSKEEYEACCRKAFLECDQSMHNVDGVSYQRKNWLESTIISVYWVSYVTVLFFGMANRWKTSLAEQLPLVCVFTVI